MTEFKGMSIMAEWTGADCSRRTCARGTSWSMSDAADLACKHKTERECSDKGLCDRATGICSCFPGYSGSSCQRTSCPNDCSGHGTCRSNRDFAYDWALAKTAQIHDDLADVSEKFEQVYFASYESAWDTAMHYGCLCDAGYRGASCAQVECPSYTDPLDDKCDPATITDFQLQYDAPFGALGWEQAYQQRLNSQSTGVAPHTQGDMSASDFNRQFIEDDNGRKVYGCYGKMSGMDCSGRGICDYSSGACKCFSGYAGTACEQVQELS